MQGGAANEAIEQRTKQGAGNMDIVESYKRSGRRKAAKLFFAEGRCRICKLDKGV